MSVSFLHRGLEEIRPDWAAPIAAELERVESTLEHVINSDVPQAYELSLQLLSAGGKRIRPSLLILGALASGECDPDRMASLAASAELMHMASLVHDDVVDETRERRGAQTANDCWGNKISVLGGDYLLSKSFSLLALNGSPEILHSLSSTAVHMSESEILQASGEGDLAVWEADYWRIIRYKTAEFMGACCECGALLAGADSETCASLHEYGVQLGLAFQIVDDLLDIAGDRELIGKPTGTDLMHGKYTLPVLIALKDSNDAESLRAMLLKGKLTSDEAREVAEKVIACGATDRARLAALDCSELALKQLRHVKPSEYSEALRSLAGFVIARES